jgi:hypothetical protein
MPKRKKPTTIKVRFWASTYSPWDVIADPQSWAVIDEFEVQSFQCPNRFGRVPHPPQTIQGVQDWMLRHDLVVADVELLKHRRRGGTWEAKYLVLLGKPSDDLSAFDKAQDTKPEPALEDACIIPTW